MGAYKAQAYPKAKVFSPRKKLFETMDLELPFSRGFSQVVGRTPWDTYTCTFLHPYLPVAKTKNCLLAIPLEGVVNRFCFVEASFEASI